MKKILLGILTSLLILNFTGCGGSNIPYPEPEMDIYRDVELIEDVVGTSSLMSVNTKKGKISTLRIRDGHNVFCGLANNAHNFCITDENDDGFFDHIIWKNYRSVNRNDLAKLDKPARYKIIYQFESGIEKAKKYNMPISIGSKGISGPNSASGVDFWLYVINVSNKTIKYIDYEVVPYNKVGDIVSSQIDKKSLKRLRYTGPLEPKTPTRNFWENVWYNPSIACSKFSSIKITWMDGTIDIVDEKDIESLMNKYVKNTCTVQN